MSIYIYINNVRNARCQFMSYDAKASLCKGSGTVACACPPTSRRRFANRVLLFEPYSLRAKTLFAFSTTCFVVPSSQRSWSNLRSLAKCFAWLYSLRCRSAAHTSDVVLPLAVSKAPWSNLRTVHLCKHRFACA